MITIDVPALAPRSSSQKRSELPLRLSASTRRHSFPAAVRKSNEVVNPADFYEVGTPLPVESPRHVDLLTEALTRLRPASRWEGFCDAVQRGYMRLRSRFMQHVVRGQACDWTDRWNDLSRGDPSVQWYRDFVFGGAAARASAYASQQALGVPCTVPAFPGAGATWEPEVFLLARALLHRVLGDVSEAEAVTQVRDGLERLKRNSEVRRYVNPVRIAGPVSDALQGVLLKREEVRGAVHATRRVFETLASYLEDDTARRQLFAVPKDAVLRKLGAGEAQPSAGAKLMLTLTQTIRRLFDFASRSTEKAS